MPSEPRTEPTLDDLSAYLDHELEAGEQARVAEHVAGCRDCQARLDGLRQTAYAVRGLPQETPPRPFRIPEAPARRSWSWAPVGWIGGVAAAMVIVIVGVQHLPGPSGTVATTSSKSTNGSQYYAPQQQGGAGAAAPSAAIQDRSALMATFSNSVTVTDPMNATRRLVLGSDAQTYATPWTMAVRVILQGDPSPSISADAQGLSLTLVRNGAGVSLGNLVGERAYGGPPVFTGSYVIEKLPLSQPVPGNYTLLASWTIPDGSGRVLQASIPITITAG
jgi:predicted anti-sigma-YlaC factor YlaD